MLHITYQTLNNHLTKIKKLKKSKISKKCHCKEFLKALYIYVLLWNVFWVFFLKKWIFWLFFWIVYSFCVDHQEYMHIAIVLVLFLWNILYVSDNERTQKIKNHAQIYISRAFVYAWASLFVFCFDLRLIWILVLFMFFLCGASNIHANWNCFGARSIEHIVPSLISDSIYDLL